MGARIVSALVAGGLLFLAGLWISASACCDWNPQDTKFWDKMSQNPQQFSYDMGARPAHFRIRAGGEEETVTPESAHNDALWNHVLHHIRHQHDEMSGAAEGRGRGQKAPQAGHQ